MQSGSGHQKHTDFWFYIVKQRTLAAFFFCFYCVKKVVFFICFYCVKATASMHGTHR